ncbi:uncharacterized protein FOMMEDRAFT_155670 [Fomitiporia mediterranea MF3/22]|uniref:uncharacterized protein n=1 Tax=Fomitiporia mediterranea (strain MF3/22) TaxID=694068 RepID=UPI00044079E6|nr:uncharacterized protein FOMMEDRAFT_155670 [Fomitiporia mediterranea MF3/22]EJD04525.1 hypothetical protein FOMMEDRAFT_155670 [Fomitiporia mediterranea MF3/22]
MIQPGTNSPLLCLPHYPLIDEPSKFISANFKHLPRLHFKYSDCIAKQISLTEGRPILGEWLNNDCPEAAVASLTRGSLRQTRSLVDRSAMYGGVKRGTLRSYVPTIVESEATLKTASSTPEICVTYGDERGLIRHLSTRPSRPRDIAFCTHTNISFKRRRSYNFEETVHPTFRFVVVDPNEAIRSRMDSPL